MSSQGYLLASAVTSNALIPVEEVTITVTQRSSDGLMNLLAIWITDESGKTKSIAIPTPDLVVSQVPSAEIPFSLVDVTAEHPLFERIVVHDVQIFPETVSIQPLQMVPLNEFPEAWDQTETFDIPPQNL